MTTLAESYAECRRLNRRHGSTYFWSTVLLPAESRPFVHALYGFCRYADDIVDRLGPVPVDVRHIALTDFGNRFFADLETGSSDDPVLAAVVDTVTRLSIDPDCFHRFLRSMEMDFTVSSYASFEHLMEYMDGSAAVIGEMMLPVLKPTSPKALEPARQLGVAFQLTNFLRDVGEDLERGRVYIPLDTLERFDVDPYERKVTDAWRAAMRYEIERTRSIYAKADEGMQYLPASSVRCIAGARRLYAGILSRIEENDYDVFTRRARVPMWRKLAIAISR